MQKQVQSTDDNYFSSGTVDAPVVRHDNLTVQEWTLPAISILSGVHISTGLFPGA